MALVELDPPIAVILTNYGLLFLLAIPLLGLRPRTLMWLCAGWVVVVPLLSQAWRAHLPAGPGDQIGLADLTDPVGLLTRLALTGYYPVLTWLAYLLAGLAVGRLHLRRLGVAVGLTLGGVLLVVAAWVVSASLVTVGWTHLVAAGPDRVVAAPWGQTQLELRGLYGTTPTTSWWWQAVVSPHSGTPSDLAQTIGSALIVLGLALIACRAVEAAGRSAPARLAAGVVEALARTGSMTLTLYCVHVVAADAQQQVAARTTLLLAHVAAAVAVASVWRARAARGPLEQVVHSVSRAAGRAAGRSGR
jgi:hypothetical protein